MAKSFYISKLEKLPGASQPIRARVANQLLQLNADNAGHPDRVFAVRVFISDNPELTGSGPNSFAVCIVDVNNQSETAADVDSLKMPDLTLDAQLGSNWNTTVRNKLQGWGFVTTGINSSTTLGDALQILCDQIGPGWSRNNFDVDKPDVV